MTKDTLIRKILDSATSGNTKEAYEAIDAYVLDLSKTVGDSNIVVGYIAGVERNTGISSLGVTYGEMTTGL